MARNIVVFSDGTGQDGGVRPDQRLSNVYKMFRAARIGADSPIDPAEQIAFYDPGLGTDADARGLTAVWRKLAKMLGSMAGRGIATNIIDCYEFICNNWRPGDRIFLIGFSRGAYTVRCVAQVLSLCGVPTHAADDPRTPFRRFGRSARMAAFTAVHRVYEHGAGHPRADFEAERDELARRFRNRYGSGDAACANASPYFIGVFDTVAALGVSGWKRVLTVIGLVSAGVLLLAPVAAIFSAWTDIGFLLTFAAASVAVVLVGWWIARRNSRRFIDDFPTGTGRHVHHIAWHASNYDRGLSGTVSYARQASAIDETRADFPRVAWGSAIQTRHAGQDEPEPLVQLFFAGNHSDVGGSYSEEGSRLSDVALQWMVDEALALPHPLQLDMSRLSIWPDPTGLQHSEPESVRDRYLWWVPSWAPRWLGQGWAEAPRKPSGFPVHPSVFARFAAAEVDHNGTAKPYRPSGFADDARFAIFRDGADDGRLAMKLSGARYHVDGPNPVEFGIGGGGDAVSTMELCNWSTAVAIFPAGSVGVDDSAYYEELAVRELKRRLHAEGFGTFDIEARPMEISGSRTLGVLAPGLTIAVAAATTRSFGQPAFVAIGEDGRATVEPSFPIAPSAPAPVEP